MILNKSLSLYPDFTVPKVSTWIDKGSGNPIEYDTWTKHLLANPAATILLATHLAP